MSEARMVVDSLQTKIESANQAIPSLEKTSACGMTRYLHLKKN